MFRHIYWFECQILTHILDWALHSNIGILDRVSHYDTLTVRGWVHERTSVIMNFVSICCWYWKLMFLLKWSWIYMFCVYVFLVCCDCLRIFILLKLSCDSTSTLWLWLGTDSALVCSLLIIRHLQAVTDRPQLEDNWSGPNSRVSQLFQAVMDSLCLVHSLWLRLVF